MSKRLLSTLLLTILITGGIWWQIEMLLEETLEMVGTLLISASLILWRDQALAEDLTNKPPD